MADLKKSDLPLLRALQQDGRISNQELASKAAMSSSACWRRMKTLEAEGIIEGYSTQLNARACGLDFHAIAHVSLARHRSEDAAEFLDAILDRSEVLDCFATTGDADYFLRVRCPDIDAYNRFLEDFLFRLKGILNVKTQLILRQIKKTTALPI